jgi:hypothetical protein
VSRRLGPVPAIPPLCHVVWAHPSPSLWCHAHVVAVAVMPMLVVAAVMPLLVRVVVAVVLLACVGLCWSALGGVGPLY